MRIGMGCFGRVGLLCFTHVRRRAFASRASAGGFVGADAGGRGEGRGEASGGTGAAVL